MDKRCIKQGFSYDFSRPGIFTVERPAGNTIGHIYPSIRYFLNDQPVTNLFGEDASPKIVDLADIAIAAYLADRVSPRREPSTTAQMWPRRFELVLGVRCREFWSSPERHEALEKLFSFLTDDEWNLSFVEPGGIDRLEGTQREFRLPPKNVPRVALFSGGLDSYAGVAGVLDADRDSDLVIVSAATNYRHIAGQRKQVEILRGLPRPAELIHRVVEFGIKWHDSDDAIQESSQRTRGLVFLILGSIAALNSRAHRLEIYENGVGAINLPMDASQIGSMNSRSVNPLTLIALERLISDAAEADFCIVNMCLGVTKGEMCTRIPRAALEGIAATFSCDGFPVRRSGKPQCGVCTSCLLRRMALEAAGLAGYDSSDGYGIDLTCDTSTPSEKQLNPLRAMEWQAELIRHAIGFRDPWTELSLIYPMLPVIAAELSQGPNANQTSIERDLVALYTRHVAEWEGFSARGHLSDFRRHRLAA